MKIGHFTKFLVGVLGTVGVITLTVSGSAHAWINEKIDLQGGDIGVAISPAKAKIDIIPGTTTTGEMRIRATGQKTNLFFVELVPFSVSNGDYVQDFSTRSSRNEILRWTTLSVSGKVVDNDGRATGGFDGCDPVDMPDSSETKIYFDMRSQEECWVTYNIDTPSNAPSGAQHAALFVQSYVDETAGGSIGVASSHRVGMTMYATNNSGTTELKGQLVKQNIPFWVFSGALNTDAAIENQGNLDFGASVSIEIKNLMGNVVYTSPNIPDASQPVIMAETTRNVSSNWDESSIGIYNVTQTVRFLDQEHVTTKLVFVIPLWLVITVLVLIAIIVIAIIYGRSKHTAKHKRMRRF